MTNEVDNLTNQVIIKDNQLANASRSIQEIESHEKEADERDDLINQLNSEIEELDNKGREIKSKINELQVELLDLKRKVWHVSYSNSYILAYNKESDSE